MEMIDDVSGRWRQARVHGLEPTDVNVGKDRPKSHAE